MSDIAEGVGGVIEGGLAGSAVEPEGGKDGEITIYDAEACANCKTVHTALYCPQCGQKRHVHRTLTAIFNDLIHGVLHLDGKFWLTLPLLVFKPGKLTRRYIDGERAKFVSPMAMFLFSVFAMFAIFQMIGLTAPTDLTAPSPEVIETRLTTELEKNEAALADVESELADASINQERREELESDRDRLQGERSQMEDIADLPFINVEETPAPEEGPQTIALDESGNTRMTMEETGIQFLDEGLGKKWRENPGLMIYKLQANAYKFSWLLIPLSVPFVWLTFAWRRRFKAYDHAIFVTYSLAFMSLLFIAVSLIITFDRGVWLGVLLMMLAPPIHLYKQLRGTYDIGRFSAFWRLLVISGFIWVVIVLFFQILFLLGAF